MFFWSRDLNRGTYELRADVKRAGELVKKLVRDTCSQAERDGRKPEIIVSIGYASRNIREILDLAASCLCTFSVKLIVNKDIKSEVTKALKKGDSIEITEMRVVNTRIPNYIVSNAGYYLQEGLKFEDAKISFDQELVRDFLIDLYDKNIKELLNSEVA